MTPPPGNVRSDGHGGLRIVIEGVEHWMPYSQAWMCLVAGHIGYLQDQDFSTLLPGQFADETGHIVPSRDDGDDIPHLLITVYPDRQYVAIKSEVVAVWEGRLDICKVVGV